MRVAVLRTFFRRCELRDSRAPMYETLPNPTKTIQPSQVVRRAHLSGSRRSILKFTVAIDVEPQVPLVEVSAQLIISTFIQLLSVRTSSSRHDWTNDLTNLMPVRRMPFLTSTIHQTSIRKSSQMAQHQPRMTNVS